VVGIVILGSCILFLSTDPKARWSEKLLVFVFC
jgi:hypothetical protein